MKKMKKTVSIIIMLASLMLLLGGMTACGGATGGKTHKIGVGLYTDTGKSVDAIKAYLGGIAEDVGCEFVYTTLSTYDEATNKTKIQELISAGCQGIIMTADMGTAAILEECEKAGVYVGGFLCDYNNSFYTSYDEVFKHPNFVGTVCDGWLDQSSWGTDVAKQVIEAGHKNVGVLIFPSYAYPNMGQVDAAFRETIEAYNATAGETEKIKLVDTVELNFAPLEATYLSDNPDLDCIFSICAGASNVYPVLVSANRTDIKLYTQGFEGTDDVENFGTGGNQCYQGLMFSAPEAVAYPLVMLIDKLNEKSFPDAPAEAQRVDCSEIIINSDEKMEALKSHSLYYTGKYEDALLSGEEVRNLCASYNQEATYKDLVTAIQTTGIEELMNK